MYNKNKRKLYFYTLNKIIYNSLEQYLTTVEKNILKANCSITFIKFQKLIRQILIINMSMQL